MMAGSWLGEPPHLAVDAAKPDGPAAAATVEANENDEATLLAADDRARFTAVVPGRRRFAPGEAVETRRAARGGAPLRPHPWRRAAVTVPPALTAGRRRRARGGR